MSEEKDYHSDEEQIWENTTEAPKDTIDDQPTDTTGTQLPEYQPMEGTDPELDAKRKRRRTILIVVFAIVLPAILILTGVGFLIWGIVVGFTNCCNSCENACNDCFGCCEGCNSCCDQCNSCTTSCDNCCGNTIDNSHATTKINVITSFKLAMQNVISLLKWYYYSIVQFLQAIFGK